MIVLAHAGHWAVQLLYLAPLVVLVWMLVAARLRERRQRRPADRSSD
jgi:membrane protein implicated in regulation of membrane protease activity